jgi:hypothetical protein
MRRGKLSLNCLIIKSLFLFFGLSILAQDNKSNPLLIKINIWSGKNDNVILKDLRTDKNLKFSDLKGKVLFINFWDSG